MKAKEYKITPVFTVICALVIYGLHAVGWIS